MQKIKFHVSRRYVNRPQMKEKLEGAYGIIYTWINLANGKEYVGQTTIKRMRARERPHKSR